MDQDIRMQFLVTAPTGGKDFYFYVPYRCVVANVMGACNADPGDAKEFTVLKSATTIGTFTFGSDVAAGDVLTYTPDTTNGQTIFDVGDVIKLTCPSIDTETNVSLDIELDPYARTTR
jgi:hypothetical protein